MKNQETIEESDHGLIEKFRKGTCKPDEALKVIQWIKEPAYRNPLYLAIKNLRYTTFETDENHDEPVNLQPALDKIHHRINIHREQTDPGFQRRIRINRVLLRVAAILILPLLVSSILYYYEKTGMDTKKDTYAEATVSPGSRLRTVLPDGTVAWLNSGTSLIYPQSFSNRTREVQLTGEAYFEVTENRRHPFVVKTGTIDIIAIGTRFNVMAYPEESYVSATLEEGKIAIEKQFEGKSNTRLCVLEPEERIVFQKDSRTYHKGIVFTDQFTAWKDGQLIFRNNSLDDIIKRLERWYNTEIEIANGSDLSQIRFTMTIENETIEQVLKYLTVASDNSLEVLPASTLKNGKISRIKYILSIH